MSLEINLALVIAICSIAGTIITAITFFNKLRWDSQLQSESIKKLLIDVNNLGAKVANVQQSSDDELKQVLNRIDIMDKSFIRMSSDLQHLQETLKDLKEHVMSTRQHAKQEQQQGVF